MPSKFTALLFQRIEADYFENYTDAPVKLLSNKTTSSDEKCTSKKAKKDKLIRQEIEKWQKRNECLNREKGIYYKELNNFCPLNKDLENQIASFLKETPNPSSQSKDNID